MAKPKRHKQTVQETNDSSILSKASIAEHGYFNDPYLKLFCAKVVRRSPLIQRGYYIRAKVIDFILNSFLKNFKSENRIQIISLGAGFDASYFRLKSLGLLNNCIYYDIDFPDVIRRKHNIIEKQSDLMQLLCKNYIIKDQVLHSDDYFTIPCDMTDISKLENMLISTKIDFSIPTLFFSECALTYVEYDESKKLCQWIQQKFSNSAVMLYEQINPNDAFGHIMVRHFDKIQSPLRRIHALDSLEKQMGLFEELNFTATVGFDMNSFFENCIDVKEKSRLEKLEIFDEYEEWHLKCSHYCMVAAFQGTCVKLSEEYNFSKKSTVDCEKKQVARIETNPFNIKIPQLQRFGHSFSMQLKNNTFLFSGGFGVASENRHDKLDDGFAISFSESPSSPYSRTAEFELVEMDMKNIFHTVTSVSENMVFMFGGRTSPQRPIAEYGLFAIDDYTLVPHETFQLKIDGVDEYGAFHPIPRWRHAAVCLKDKIFISGGRSVTNMALDDLWSFRLSTKVWKLEHLGGALKPCHTHTMDVWNNSLVLFGGLSHHQSILSQLTIISLEEETCSKVIETSSEIITPRYSHSSHVLHDNLFIVGGIDITCDTQPPILIVSLIDKTWRSVHLPICDPARPLMLHNHRSIMLDEKTIVIVGGGGNCFSFGSYFNPNLTVIDISSEMQSNY